MAGGAGVGDAGDDEEVVVLEKGVVIALAGVFQDLGSGFLQELLQGRLILQVDMEGNRLPGRSLDGGPSSFPGRTERCPGPG